MSGRNTSGYFTPVRVVFWCLMVGILGFVALVWIFGRGPRRGSDRAHCIMNQRNIQQGVRSYQNEHGLKAGAVIDWDQVIGPGMWLEELPECPVHGRLAYRYASVFPEVGTLAAPCEDPEHRLASTQDW